MTSQAPFAVGLAAPARRLIALGRNGDRPELEAAEPPKPPAPVVLAAKDLAKVYGEGSTAVRALDGASLEVRKGEIVAIMGPSGSGKSTMLHLLGALETPSAGQISLGGERYDGLDDAGLTRIRRDRIGFVFQFFNLLPSLTAEENVLLAGADRRRVGRPGALALARAPRRGRPRRPGQPPAVRALRRRAAAGLDRPRAPSRAGADPRRRADRKPRQPLERRDPGASARPLGLAGPDASSWSRTIPAPRRSPTGSCSFATARSPARRPVARAS